MRPASQPPQFWTCAIALLLLQCVGVRSCLEGLNCDPVPAHPVPAHPTAAVNELELRWDAEPRRPAANPMPEPTPWAEAEAEADPGNYGYNGPYGYHGPYGGGGEACCAGCHPWQCGHSYTPHSVWTPSTSICTTTYSSWSQVWTPTHSWTPTPTPTPCCECGECGAVTVVKTVYGGAGGCNQCGETYQTYVTSTYVQAAAATTPVAQGGYCSTLYAKGPGLPTEKAGACGTILVLNTGNDRSWKWDWPEVTMVTTLIMMHMFGGFLLMA